MVGFDSPLRNQRTNGLFFIGEFGMNFLEKDLEEIIFTTDKNELGKRGLPFHNKSRLLRQKKIGNYGVADLIEVRRPFYHIEYRELIKGEITVFELKQEKIGISAFLQALRYLKGIQSYLEKRKKDHYFNYSITLVGKSIDLNSSYAYLADFTNLQEDVLLYHNSGFCLRNFTYRYDFDGIWFDDQCSFSLKHEGF